MSLTQSLITSVSYIYSQLQANQRLYLNAFGFLVAFLVAKIFQASDVEQVVLVLFLTFWTIAITFDLVSLYKRIYETVIGKALIVVLFSICANVAIALSSQAVNDITGVDPSKFPHTVALLSILTIPVFIMVGSGFLSIILLGFIPVFIMIDTISYEKVKVVFFPWLASTEKISYPKITRSVQIISFAVFCALIFGWYQKKSKNYETFLTETAQSFLYELEMYPKSSCKVASGVRVGFLGDGQILVGSKTGSTFTFLVQECKGRT